MLVSFNWLNEFIDCKDIGPERVAESLTMAGLEVEGISSLKESVKDLLIGTITSLEPHPKDERLKICRVFLGKDEIQIVSGAPYLEVGKKVVVAPQGTSLPNGEKVESIVLKGVESYGTFISEYELALVDREEVETVIFLEDAEPGSPAADVLGMDDYVLETSPTPNRGDCLGIIGIARELSALLRRPLCLPAISISEEGPSIDEIVDVKIEDPDLCRRYAARFIEEVTVKPSPLWMKVRLKATGLRPISNIVDVTNYVLVEMGHPLHAFDFEDIRGEKIVVRRAKDKETIVTLDGVERKLDLQMLVIADVERPVALAGIMGGANSEVKETTTRVLIESAYFDPICVRRASKRLNLATEASKRFERGTDIEGLIVALNRATQLMAELSGGKVARGIKDEYPQVYEPKKICLSFSALNSTLGCKISSQNVKEILSLLGFKIRKESEGSVEIGVPSFRAHDVKDEVDLIEEIARIYGYEKIPSTMPAGPIPRERIENERKITAKAQEILAALGLQEVINYSFINPIFSSRLRLSAKDPRSDPVVLLNPLSKDISVMRTTLIPGLLDTAARNEKVQEKDIAIFEVGRVFIKRGVLREKLHVGALCMGKRPSFWDEKSKNYDFFFLKAVAERLVSEFCSKRIKIRRSSEPFLHPGRAADVFVDGVYLGFLGELHPKIAEEYEFSSRCYILELDLQAISSILKALTFTPLPKYPGIRRDLSLIAPENLSHEKIEETIFTLSSSILKEVKLIDLYTGPPIEKGKRSLTYSLFYLSEERTLVDEEVQEEQEKLITALEEKLPVKIRR